MTAETKLTPEQIKNWRSVLLTLVGPWAFMMPDELRRESEAVGETVDKLLVLIKE